MPVALLCECGVRRELLPEQAWPQTDARRAVPRAAFTLGFLAWSSRAAARGRALGGASRGPGSGSRRRSGPTRGAVAGVAS